MGIVPIRRAHTEHYTQVPHYISRDNELSILARGLLVYLLSLPPGWQKAIDDLARDVPDSRDRLRGARHELEAAGYLRTRREQDKHGRWAVIVEVYDTAQPAHTGRGTSRVRPDQGKHENPQVAPDAVIPAAGNPRIRTNTEDEYGTEYGLDREALAIPSQAIEVSTEVGEQPQHVTRARAIASQRWASPQDIAAQQAAESRARRQQREAQEDTGQRDEPRIMNSAALERWSIMFGDGTAFVVGTADDMQAMATLLALDDELRKDTQMTPLVTLKTWRQCSSRAAR